MLSITTLREGSGRLQHHVGVVFDLTEKKRTEAALLQSNKMEAIGTLAGGIAHDFNNILTSILGFNHSFLGDLANPDIVAEHIKQIHTAGTRAKDLVHQILTFSRQMPSPKSPVDLCQILDDVHHLLRPTVPSNINLVVEMLPDRPLVAATSIQLNQILMNLYLNAVDAIGDGWNNFAGSGPRDWRTYRLGDRFGLRHSVEYPLKDFRSVFHHERDG